MLIIQSLFFHIAISLNEPYAIYTNEYMLDRDGNLVTDMTDLGNCYGYGDLIIQTTTTKYVVKKVYSAFEYAAEIIEYIGKHYSDNLIYINMFELNERWNDDCGKLEVEILR